MPAGWNQTSGTFREGPISEDTFWMLFNYVFSDSSAKRTTYKFGLIKSILDNLFNSEIEQIFKTLIQEVIGALHRSNKIPGMEYVKVIQAKNDDLRKLNSAFVQNQFKTYRSKFKFFQDT